MLCNWNGGAHNGCPIDWRWLRGTRLAFNLYVHNFMNRILDNLACKLNRIETCRRSNAFLRTGETNNYTKYDIIFSVTCYLYYTLLYPLYN